MISAVGAERLNWGVYGWNPIAPDNNLGTVTLHQYTLDYDVSLNGITVDSGSQNFRDGIRLTASNLTIDSGASSELTARDDIHINSEFEAHAKI